MTNFGKMFRMINFCTSFGGKNYFLLWNIGSVNAQKCDSTCSKKGGGLVEICQAVHGGVSKFTVLGEQEGVILFCCSRTGCSIRCFVIIRAFSCWSPVCRNHFMFTLSLIWHDQCPSNWCCFQIWLLNPIYKTFFYTCVYNHRFKQVSSL